MNKKILLTTLCLVILCGITSLSAQNENTTRVSTTEYTPNNILEEDAYTQSSQPERKHYNTYKTTWMKNRFKDTWYIALGSGAQIILAEDDSKGSFSSRITYAPTLTIGKYFSPIWGLRLNFTGGTLHGFNDGNSGTYRKWNSGSKNYLGEGWSNIGQPGYPSSTGAAMQTWDPRWGSLGYNLNNSVGYHGGTDTYYWIPGRPENGEQLYMQHVRYMAINLNFMFDFLTLIGNYNPYRVFEVTPYGGLTYAHVFPHHGYEKYDVFGLNGGLNFKIRLSSKFDLNVEGALTMYPDDFDGHEGGSRSFDLVAQTTAGVTYKIGKSTWDVCEPMNYDLIRDLNNRINDLKTQLDNIPPCPDCPPCPPPAPPKEEKEIKFLPDPVFFRLDKSVIDNAEWEKIEKAVAYLEKYPDAKVVVTGYADRKTGNPSYNYRLSERRAKTVSKALTEKYQVNPARISINWEGDKIQPFEVNEWNRVVVFVIE